MAVLYAATGLTGNGSAPFPGGGHNVGDVEVRTVTVGHDVHVFPTGPDWRLQHVGWYGLAFVGSILPAPIGAPTVEICWWHFIDFAAEDFGPGLDPLTFFPDTFVWNLQVGCSIDVKISG